MPVDNLLVMRNPKHVSPYRCTKDCSARITCYSGVPLYRHPADGRNAISGQSQVSIYLDDLLVTGALEEYLHTLERVSIVHLQESSSFHYASQSGIRGMQYRQKSLNRWRGKQSPYSKCTNPLDVSQLSSFWSDKCYGRFSPHLVTVLALYIVLKTDTPRR